MLQEGTQIGHYRLLRRIGKGGMGYVYLAENIHLNTQQVAIKVINPNILDNPDAQRLFLREAKAAATLDHPHILPLNDYGEVSIDGETYPYMVMPVRMEGTLKEWLEQHSGADKLSPTTVVKMVEQAASALQHAHDHQILHLDVKPSNFLLRYTMGKQEAPDLLLTDFGLAKVMNTEVSLSNTSRGTPPYMAPEQWKGSPVAATDQYALATMAYEMLTGRTPFQGDLIALMNQHLYTPPPPPSTFRPDLPKAVDEVLLHALAKDPKDRFASVSAFANALRQALLPEDSQLLRTTLIISQQEARKGTSRNLELPGAKRVNVTIPAGVHSGQVIRLSVRGEATGNATSDAVGTLMITVVVAPEEKITPPNPQTPFPPSRTWLFAGLALLIVLVGTVIYLGDHHGGPTGGSPSSTPIVHKTNPSTTPTAATATPISTVTPSPTTVAWQQLYSEATTGQPVLNDPLVNNSHGYGWDEIPTVTEGGTCSFIDKAYHATIDQNNTFYRCTARNTIFGNFAYQVQMVIQKGDEGGVIFRFDRALVTFYSFHLSTDASYRLDIDNQQGFVRTLSEGTSPTIKIGHNQTNMITVIAQNSSIVLYVNGQYVTNVTDSTYSRGSIGVMAQDDFNPTNVAFTDAKVWLPPNGQAWPL